MDKIQIEKFIAEGFTKPQIAVALGKSTSQVGRLLKKYGLKTKRYNDHDPNATHRICRYCGEKYPIEEFAKASSKDGNIYRRWRCLSCYSKLKADRRQGIRLWLRELKSNLCCNRCGNDDFRVLQFHHNGNKHFNVADALRWGYAKDRILSEINKCEVICANCHQIETFDTWQKKSG
jgi:ribosomal protein L37E